MLDKNCFSKISDLQLLNIANNIISPDASIDKFQLKYKNDRYKEDMVKVCEEDMKREFKLKKSIETLKKSRETDHINTAIESPFTKLPKNIKKAMEYYTQLNN